MSNVYLYVAVGAFVLAALLLVAAAVVFVRLDVPGAVHFLRSRRAPRPAGGGARPAKATDAPMSRARATEGDAEAPGKGDTSAAPSADASSSEDVGAAHAAEGGEKGPARAPGVEGAPIRARGRGPVTGDPRAATERLAPVGDDEAEQPTSLLDELGLDDSERPTDALLDADEASEDQTSLLAEEGVPGSGISADGAAPRGEEAFFFTLKQDIVVVHTMEALS